MTIDDSHRKLAFRMFRAQEAILSYLLQDLRKLEGLPFLDGDKKKWNRVVFLLHAVDRLSLGLFLLIFKLRCLSSMQQDVIYTMMNYQ